MSEETKQLEAGRELDRLVAEKMAYPVRLGEDGRTFGIFVVYGDSKPHFLPIPGFSTEIDMAWKIWGFILDNYPGCRFSVSGGWGKSWVCNIEIKDKSNPIVNYGHSLRADTAPLAICRAFLALGLE
jgi:hypothetical protein